MSKFNTSGIIINLAALKQVNFNSNKTEVTLQGGALISDVVAAGAANNALITTGLCNCVGALGAILGGGIGNLMGQFGLGVDNVINLRVVTPTASFVDVSATSNEDLWFALRGAGANYGIVTSATLKSHPVATPDQLNATLGTLMFAPSKLESLVSTLGNLTMSPKMSFELIMAANGANTTSSPLIIVNIFYYGTPQQGRTAFGPVYALGPLSNQLATTSYTHWNDGADAACIKGGRKPNFATGLGKLDPSTWREVYHQLSQLVQNRGAENSSVTLLAFPTAVTRSLAGDDASYPWRQKLSYFAMITPSYTDPGFDSTAQIYGFRVRDLWRASSGLPGNQTYINNAYGDEGPADVYGDSLDRLQQIKKKRDPLNRFAYWFPIS